MILSKSGKLAAQSRRGRSSLEEVRIAIADEVDDVAEGSRVADSGATVAAERRRNVHECHFAGAGCHVYGRGVAYVRRDRSARGASGRFSYENVLTWRDRAGEQGDLIGGSETSRAGSRRILDRPAGQWLLGVAGVEQLHVVAIQGGARVSTATIDLTNDDLGSDRSRSVQRRITRRLERRSKRVMSGARENQETQDERTHYAKRGQAHLGGFSIM